MYIDKLVEAPDEVTRGVWQDSYTDYWIAVVQVGDEVYDLGRFGSFVDAGEAYLKVKKALEG